MAKKYKNILLSSYYGMRRSFYEQLNELYDFSQLSEHEQLEFFKYKKPAIIDWIHNCLQEVDFDLNASGSREKVEILFTLLTGEFSQEEVLKKATQDGYLFIFKSPKHIAEYYKSLNTRTGMRTYVKKLIKDIYGGDKSLYEKEHDIPLIIH